MGESAMGGTVGVVFFLKNLLALNTRGISGCVQVHTIIQAVASAGLSHPDRGYDLFVTAALSDGAKLWDLRQAGDVPVQKFDSSVSGRHLCGVALREGPFNSLQSWYNGLVHLILSCRCIMD